ncbi:hypothetical protein QN382_20260 [Pseudomonas sp. 10B1]|uniref:hypothetical protein n=1 Tax=unclassified Pseudomonas TaxID=196821 RepID=UPI002B2251DA|nr:MULTISPECIES: hypothetical protein [unclassified Pseudomonas]MEA9994845.1 hypothetical protein [Pseudomonas sp. AA4]MEB0127209.1 hypothetical protein [Pseudomonas sp. CCC1.2]MEB0155813.1 hypothetical protein [Pseudomonas sp. CCC4.3]MEB0219490.1 hypothetical protein [Pseudomonas sp. AB12(2023)]MEB0311609.1 hypothetical protein [Pseudomonas sp. 10B1]
MPILKALAHWIAFGPLVQTRFELDQVPEFVQCVAEYLYATGIDSYYSFITNGVFREMF